MDGDELGDGVGDGVPSNRRVDTLRYDIRPRWGHLMPHRGNITEPRGSALGINPIFRPLHLS